MTRRGDVARYAAIETAALAQGWRCERTRKGHRRLIPPDASAPIVIGAGSISDYRGPVQFLSDARWSGLVFPWPPQRRKRRPPASTTEAGDTPKGN